MSIKEHFQELEKKLKDIEIKLSSGDSLSSSSMASLGKEHSRISELLGYRREIEKKEKEINNLNELIQEEDDEEFVEEARKDLEEALKSKEKLESKIYSLLMPPDPLDEKNIIMEIRAGTGGEESSLFAADLFRMYAKYADRCKWKIEPLSSHPTGIGGFKEIIFLITGKNVYSYLKLEMGVHRVQRVPVTEASGRVHTSAVTVAVLPEAEDVDIEIDETELRIDVFRSSGPGGQSVNTTDSAVRITHIPTGIVISCQDEKSQIKNRAKAMKILKTRLLEQKREEEAKKRSDARRVQIGSGDRSEKIRTYNFKENRVTDHRINLTLYRLTEILEGDLDELIDSLVQREVEKKMESMGIKI